MLNVRNGQPYSLTLEFLVGDQPVMPQSSSIAVELYGQSGELLDTFTVADPLQPTVVIPATYHVLTADRAFEKRTLRYGFDAPTGWQERQITYYVHPFYNHTVTPQTVRSFIGISASELPDSDVDLVRAYLLVADDVGRSDLDTALQSGTIAELRANEMIMLRAVIDVMPSIMQRVHQMEADGVLQVRRNSVKDFTPLLAEAQSRYRTLLDDLIVVPVPAPVIFMSVRGPDAVTGG